MGGPESALALQERLRELAMLVAEAGRITPEVSSGATERIREALAYSADQVARAAGRLRWRSWLPSGVPGPVPTIVEFGATAGASGLAAYVSLLVLGASRMATAVVVVVVWLVVAGVTSWLRPRVRERSRERAMPRWRVEPAKAEPGFASSVSAARQLIGGLAIERLDGLGGVRRRGEDVVWAAEVDSVLWHLCQANTGLVMAEVFAAVPTLDAP